MHELAGVREALGVRSEIGVPLDVGGRRRGMVMVASQKPDYFDDADVEFVATAARWVGLVAERSQMIEAMKRKAVDDSRNATAEELITVLSHDLRNYLSPDHAAPAQPEPAREPRGSRARTCASSTARWRRSVAGRRAGGRPPRHRAARRRLPAPVDAAGRSRRAARRRRARAVDAGQRGRGEGLRPAGGWPPIRRGCASASTTSSPTR